jgi:hypothetical protein
LGRSAKPPAYYKVVPSDYAAHKARKKIGKQELIPLLPFSFRALAAEQGIGDDIRQMSEGEQFHIFSSFDEAHNLAMDRLSKKDNPNSELKKALEGRIESLILRNRAKGLTVQEIAEIKRIRKTMGKLKASC